MLLLIVALSQPIVVFFFKVSLNTIYPCEVPVDSCGHIVDPSEILSYLVS